MTARFLSFFGVAMLLLVYTPRDRAQAQTGKPAYLRVLLAEEKATVWIDGRATKQSGPKRIFVTPGLAPAKPFTYGITAIWASEDSGFTLRSRQVTVQSGKVIEVDLRKADDKFPDLVLAKFVEAPEEVIDAMCELAGVGKEDVVYEIGCGNGAMVVGAVADHNAKRGVGIDLDLELLQEAIEYAKEEKVDDKVVFRKEDLLAVRDLHEASVIMLGRGKALNTQLAPILKQNLKPGTRIVSTATMADWKADKMETVEAEVDGKKSKHTIYLWTIGK